jgi:NAD(P)-dependent dehydrogenase (short-subunit alcohol dehydrogenase family)
MNPTDARIVLTGAAGGIGSAVARQLARSGAALLLTDLRQEPLDRLAAELARSGNVPRTVAADVATEAGRAALVAAAREQRSNVLINAAGINPFGLFPSNPPPRSPRRSTPAPAAGRCYRARTSARAHHQRGIDVRLDRLPRLRRLLGQ